MVSLSDYKCAHDLFYATRDAALDADRICMTLDRLKAAEGVRGASLSGHVSGGSNADAMSRTNARIDYEERVRTRQEEDYKLIDLTCSVIYGEDLCNGGIASLKGCAVADALWWRYCAAAKWSTVERMVGMSERWCRYACNQAFDTIDAYGFDRVISGVGIAEN